VRGLQSCYQRASTVRLDRCNRRSGSLSLVVPSPWQWLVATVSVAHLSRYITPIYRHRSPPICPLVKAISRRLLAQTWSTAAVSLLQLNLKGTPSQWMGVLSRSMAGKAPLTAGSVSAPFAMKLRGAQAPSRNVANEARISSHACS
jgi:hypothetical protein